MVEKNNIEPRAKSQEHEARGNSQKPKGKRQKVRGKRQFPVGSFQLAVSKMLVASGYWLLANDKTKNEKRKTKILFSPFDKLRTIHFQIFKFSNYIILSFFILTLSSCGKEAFFDDTVEIPNHTWKHSDMIQFKVEVTDTISQYDFFINIRHTKSYSYSNLFVFFHTTSPEGKKQTDTLEFPMADPEGNYVGDVSGGLVMNRVIIKKEVRFPKSGNYIFTIEQAMRDKELEEITDVGLTLVENNN